MKQISTNISKHIRLWASKTKPVLKGEFVPLARVDRFDMRKPIESLFFENSGPEEFVPLDGLDAPMLRAQKFTLGGLRNSFFPEIFRKHTKFNTIRLHLEFEGAFNLEIFQSSLASLPEKLRELDLHSAPDGEPAAGKVDIPFALETEIAKNSRIFCTLRAERDQSVIRDAAWLGEAPHDSVGRMVVVLRTFGRTSDIKRLLNDFSREAEGNPDYARILNNIFFFVLDTSDEVSEGDHAEIKALKHIHACSVKGINLGGGGNMSQALFLVKEAVDKAKAEVSELLLLDDDLIISLETLCRHWSATLFRSDNSVFTLPVLMKSEPLKIWEDGALWGRFLDENMSGQRSSLFPRLLRHGKVFGGNSLLDEVAKAHYPEYCTFIFFSLPYERFIDLGYPAAFFLRGDDIDYSLRHRGQAGHIFSNPNLCAWHEAAHSYGHEYMSIAHGIILNMRYGNDRPDHFAKFFVQRLNAHMSIGDALGIQLYAQILQDLNERSFFLQEKFAEKYVEKLSFFRDFDQKFEYLADELREDIRRASRDRNEFLGEYFFLNPPVEPNRHVSRVVLENPYSGLFHIYDPKSIEAISACVAAAAHLTAGLNKFINDYDELRAHYIARLDCVSQEFFWKGELSNYPAPEIIPTPV